MKERKKKRGKMARVHRYIAISSEIGEKEPFGMKQKERSVVDIFDPVLCISAKGGLADQLEYT